MYKDKTQSLQMDIDDGTKSFQLLGEVISEMYNNQKTKMQQTASLQKLSQHLDELLKTVEIVWSTDSSIEELIEKEQTLVEKIQTQKQVNEKLKNQFQDLLNKLLETF